MTPEQIQELIDKLLGMGETMATQGFRLALLQVQVNFWQNAAWIVFLFLVEVGLYKLFRHALAKFEDNEEWAMGIIFPGIFGLAIGFIIATLLSQAIAFAINPEWYAIEKIMSLLP